MEVSSVEFPDLSKEKTTGVPSNMGLLLDVTMPLTVELGRTTMPIKDVLSLGTGSIVELDKNSGDPADIYVNGKLIAKGEVLVIDESYGIRITEVLGSKPEEL
jgi:flagellar motor switch protein FliN/FliY